MICYKKKFKFVFLLLFFFNSCISLPGIDKNPKQKKLEEKDSIISEFSMNDVKINIIDINSLTLDEIKNYNENKIEELDYKVNKFPNIYEYKYEYVLGPADSLSINLTDTDDLDGTYLIDEDGMIDLPFISKVKLNNLTLNQAQNYLLKIIEDFYKNPDLQINIEEFNSSKVYIIGAVRNQITLNLNQKPIRLIEAAIQE